MRGKLLKDQLLFDPEIERTTRKLNSKTRKRKQLSKQRNQHEGTSNSIALTTPLIEEVMVEPIVLTHKRALCQQPKKKCSNCQIRAKCEKSINEDRIVTNIV